jgi:peptide deformylase
MAKLKILQYPDPLLKRKAKLVTDFKDPALQEAIDDMLETFCETENCAGLAATQLSLNDPFSVTVMAHPDNPEEIMCLINPEIIKKIGQKTLLEGCMSVFPQLFSFPIERAEEIVVKAFDRSGKEIHINAKNLLAKAIQHEIDHLNGTLYIDHLSKLKRDRLETKIHKILEQQKKKETQ